jgi:hypothetical protein
VSFSDTNRCHTPLSNAQAAQNATNNANKLNPNNDLGKNQSLDPNGSGTGNSRGSVTDTGIYAIHVGGTVTYVDTGEVFAVIPDYIVADGISGAPENLAVNLVTGNTLKVEWRDRLSGDHSIAVSSTGGNNRAITGLSAYYTGVPNYIPNLGEQLPAPPFVPSYAPPSSPPSYASPNPPNTEPSRSPQLQPQPANPVKPKDYAPPVVAPPAPTAPTPPVTPSSDPSKPNLPSSSGAPTPASSSAPKNFRAGFQTPNPYSGEKPAYVSPAYEQPAFESKPYVSGVSNPADYGKQIGSDGSVRPNPTASGEPTASQNPATNPTPLSTPTKTPSATTPNTPNTPSNGTTADTGQILGAIAALAATVAGGLTLANYIKGLNEQINQQTSPTAQQTNAKQGVCDAMQPSQCGYEGVKAASVDATNPIKDQTVANAGLLANIISALASLASVVANIFNRVGDIWTFLNRVWQNQAVDKVMQFITMITVIHNATMLTRSIADTLGSAIDQGLQVFGLQLKDKEGNQIGVSAIIGQSVQNLIKAIIGADNYTALNETWVQANRVYQTGINLISNIQSIVDSATAVAELTNNRLGTLMNALRNSGTVRENAYGAQSENVTKFNAFQNRLENLEQGVSNVASITGNIASVQQSVNELKSNRTEFDNALKNKPQGTGLTENDAEKAAREGKKEQSLYTIGDFSVVKPPETP